MTKEQYDFTIQFRGIIEMFCKCGEYVGGADALFDYWGLTGQEKGCPSCKSRLFLELNEKIKQYEA